MKFFSDERVTLFQGDIFEELRNIPEDLVQTAVTSPTYWGKRSFLKDPKEFGSEKLEVYVQRNVDIYSALLDKMKKNGSLFVIIQDTYMGSGVSRSHHNHWEHNKDQSYKRDGIDSSKQGNTSSVTARHETIKNKSLSAIPYRIAIKLVDMGFLWREQIIWEKPNPMPENVNDRVRQSAELILHFTKSGKYKFNPEPFQIRGKNGKMRMDNQVWIYPPEPKPGHTATYPSKIAKRLVLATSDEGDTIMDPFVGSGTLLNIAVTSKRKFIGVDINPQFLGSTLKIYERSLKNTTLLEGEKMQMGVLDNP